MSEDKLQLSLEQNDLQLRGSTFTQNFINKDTEAKGISVTYILNQDSVRTVYQQVHFPFLYRTM